MINLSINYQKSLVTLLIVVITSRSAAQLNTFERRSISDFHRRDTIRGKLDRSDFSIDLTVSVLPPAKISRDQGNYRLQSRLQSAYNLGFNYIYNVNKSLSIELGFHTIVGRWGFYLNIPDEDVSAYNVRGKFIVSNKEVWGTLKIPLLIEKKVYTRKLGLISAEGGINLRYSGFNSDLGIGGGGIMTTNNQVIQLFESDFSLRNKNKPWITFLAGVSKLVRLKNYDVLSLGLQADVSFTNFLIGDYTITVPGKPVTSGTYSINGSSVGISLGYRFTGTNKRLVREYVK
jgi:hypothetical protein